MITNDIEQPFNLEQVPKLINTLLVKLELHVKNNNAEDAQLELKTLNNNLTAWCESDRPPSFKELSTIKENINVILNQASNHKADSFNALLKHKKNNKAISAYKNA